MSSSDCLLDPLESSHHHLFQGFLCRLFEDTDTWVKVWWWSTCVLTIHYLLLLVLMFCTFLCDCFFCVASLSLSLWMQISAGMFLIFFQLIKGLWGRREHEVWSRVLWAQAACSQQLYPAVHGYSRNKWIAKELPILFSKSGKKGFLEILRKLKQRKGFCYHDYGSDEKTSDHYLRAAKFTESLLQTPTTTWYSLKGQPRFTAQSCSKFSPYFV